MDNIDTWTVYPTPGYVIKFKEVVVNELDGETKRKCFINLCHSNKIPPPMEDLDEDTLASRLDSGDYSYRVPVCVGEVECVTDNKQEDCLKIDVLLNTHLYELRLDQSKSDFFRHFITLLLCEAIENKHTIKLDPNAAIILINRRSMGTISPMKLNKNPEKHVVYECESNTVSRDGVKSEPNPLSPEKAIVGVTARLFKGQRMEFNLSLADVSPPVENGTRLRLQVGENRVVLLLDNRKSLYDFCVPHMLDPKTVKSKLCYSKNALIVSINIIIPS